MKICNNCKNPLSDETIICPYCETKFPFKKKNSVIGILSFIFSLTFVFSFIGLIFAIIDLVKNKCNKHGLSIAALIISSIAVITLGSIIGDTENSNTTTTDSSSSQIGELNDKTKEISEDEYKSTCAEIDYKTLARSPETYRGNKYRFKGKVIQVQEPSGFNQKTTLRINVTCGEYGIWDDTIYATVVIPDGNSRILEDDIITMWAEVKGLKTYTTVLGSSLSIPEIEIKYYQIENE